MLGVERRAHLAQRALALLELKLPRERARDVGIAKLVRKPPGRRHEEAR